MSRTTSSNGPGIGSKPSAANHRSGLGMRESVAANLTARIVRLTKATVYRTSGEDSRHPRPTNPKTSRHLVTN
jgi:hypothetical protein